MSCTARLHLRSIILKLAIVASALFGILQHDLDISGGYMRSIFMAFTIQSNIWIAVLSLVLLSLHIISPQHDPLSKTSLLPGWIRLIRLMFLSAILLTWSVFAILLTPIMQLSYLASASNIFLHNLTPILALVDYLLDSRDSALPPKAAPAALITPITYTIFFVIAYELTDRIPVQYFFLDYRRYGWFRLSQEGLGSAWWILILFTVMLGISTAIRALKISASRRPLKTSIICAASMASLSLLTALLSVMLRS